MVLSAVASFSCWLAFGEEICLCFDTAIRVAVCNWTRLCEEQCKLSTVNTPTFVKILLPAALFREHLLSLTVVATASSISSFYILLFILS